MTKVEVGKFTPHANISFPDATRAGESLRGHIRAVGARANGLKLNIIGKIIANPTAESLTGTVGELPFIPYTTIFNTKQSFKLIPLSAFIDSFTFRFRTRSKDDMVLFDARAVVVMLVNRDIHVVTRLYEASDDNAIFLPVQRRSRMNDGQWHRLAVSSNSFCVGGGGWGLGIGGFSLPLSFVLLAFLTSAVLPYLLFF